jgi:hypothetical protein
MYDIEGKYNAKMYEVMELTTSPSNNHDKKLILDKLSLPNQLAVSIINIYDGFIPRIEEMIEKIDEELDD